MKHIRYFKTFEGCGISSSGDIVVKRINDLFCFPRFLESSQYNNDSITRDEFFRLLNLKEIFGKNEVDKLTKPINAGTTFHLGLVPAMNIKRFFSGNDYDVNKISIKSGRYREMSIWKLPDYYYLICVEIKSWPVLYMKCDDIGGTMEIIRIFTDLSKDISIRHILYD
jgi:hypothetical protein